MIIDEDIKFLNSFEGKRWNRKIIIFSIAMIFIIAMIFTNLYISNKIASLENKGLFDVIKFWLDSFNANESYSGIMLKALERLGTSLMLIMLLVWVASTYLGEIILRKKLLRILQFIKDKNDKHKTI